jgi:EAL domain-containing protein (putative c-di-GMP-specific phosphodiesterase class I)
MQPRSKSEPYTLLEYQSSEPRVFGVEVRSHEGTGLQPTLSALRWLGMSKPFARELTFVVVTLSARTGPGQIRQIARCASHEGLADKLCVVVPATAQTLHRTVCELGQCGVRALLGGVGASSRFSDLTEHVLDGVVIEPSLLSRAAGDPCAASILDAIISLAENLGLKSFANECATETEFDAATVAGISYVAFARPSQERGRQVLSRLQQLPRTAERRQVMR